MPTCVIDGITIKFPFEPYDIQKTYMEKVIYSLKNEQNAVLESPTGTGKTLSLLCAALGWLETKKAQVQLERLTKFERIEDEFFQTLSDKLNQLNEMGNPSKEMTGRAFLGLPTIIYTSRTHSQLTQAVQELKRSGYSHMKACVMGSREQMCIHPEIMQETNNTVKIHMCRLKVKSRSCMYNNRNEKIKDDPRVKDLSVLDIEDMVKLGNSLKFCPYYMAKEIKNKADIIFMPYNYVLDPKLRKSFGLNLKNNVVILDEGHNIEKICEDSASFQLKSTDVTMCIEEITAVMKAMSKDSAGFNDDETPRDFTADELCSFKEMLLNFEKAFDAIPLKPTNEGTTFEGKYIFELFEMAGINGENQMQIVGFLDKLVQFLSVVGGENGPFQRRGTALQMFQDLLGIVFASADTSFRDKMNKCFKVHILVEEPQKKDRNSWLAKATKTGSNRILNFWCFSPGFGMNELTGNGIRSIILTSGSLAPLPPLISELELENPVLLENPHVVGGSQIYVRVVGKGPDGEPLISTYQNRNNEAYIKSLGQSIVNLTRMIPNGLLIFFPSYPVMLNCQKVWQEKGIWSNISQQKAIFVEPRDKISFNNAMTDYYTKINDPTLKGAIFMGVCRGKVSEGLDFADINGRAVIITGIPYPPLKDPRVVLKRNYMNTISAENKMHISGEKWYTLEACRAINQAIGRVIRHRNDYGAILLLDARFGGANIRSHLSLWLRNHVAVSQNFGEIMRDLRLFFKNADTQFSSKLSLRCKEDDISEVVTTLDNDNSIEVPSFPSSSSSSILSDSVTDSKPNTLKRGDITSLFNVPKRKKITVVSNFNDKDKDDNSNKSPAHREYIAMVQKRLDVINFKKFITYLRFYQERHDFEVLVRNLDDIFISKHHLRYLIQGLEPYIDKSHKEGFNTYWERMR